MKKYILCVLILAQTTSCTTFVSNDYFAIISNKKISNNSILLDKDKTKNFKSKYCDYILLFFPLGVKTKNMSEVVISEIEKFNVKNNTDYNAIMNVNVVRKFTMGLILDSNCLYIEGQLTKLNNNE